MKYYWFLMAEISPNEKIKPTQKPLCVFLSADFRRYA